MSKKFLKQLGNIVVMQAAGYAVGEAFKALVPKVKRAMGIEEDEAPESQEAVKTAKHNKAKSVRVESKEIKDLIRETKEGVAKKKDQPPVDAKVSEEE